ncbi:hypothetical protein OC834_001559 [Tilletia horrida]|nr:hypothetical protein OC834_001559 [Tilletia horrida]KAK0536970.1 hypothetical protein OC835_001865 [Tilletia horrida]KAK0564586.1 hypothetical protein OC844_001634 [Tilletia horrida]
MPFYNKRRSSSPHSPTTTGPALPDAMLDELTDSIGSLLSIHNLSDLERSADGTPRTRPNSFCSVGSSTIAAAHLGPLAEEEDVPAPSAEDQAMNELPSPINQQGLRRGSDNPSSGSKRSGPPHRPRPLIFNFSGFATSNASESCPSSEELPSPTTSFNPRRRQGSLILAVDELDIKRQKRSSVPSFSGTYGWSFGISDSERAHARSSFSYGTGPSSSSAVGRECPASPLMPFSPIISPTHRPASD